MGNLIDRDDVINAIEDIDMQIYEGNKAVGGTNYLTKDQVIYCIENIPSSIVCCKDCRYSHMTINGEGKYCDINEKTYVSGDFFCAYAERKE